MEQARGAPWDLESNSASHTLRWNKWWSHSLSDMHGDAENQLCIWLQSNRVGKVIIFFCEKMLKTKPPNCTKFLLFTSHVRGCHYNGCFQATLAGMHMFFLSAPMQWCIKGIFSISLFFLKYFIGQMDSNKRKAW